MIRILHIDDNINELELFKLQMNRLSGDLAIDGVTTASEIATRKDIQEHYDCIVCDYQLPAMDGLELLNILRGNKIDIPFIFITGQGNEELAAEALRAGADDYYIKDSGLAYYERLLNSIRNLVTAHISYEEKRRAEHALRESEETARVLLNAPSDEILLLDPEGTILDANNLTITSRSRSQDGIIGESAYNVFPIDLAKARMEIIKEVVRTGEPAQFEDQIEGRCWANTIYPVFDQAGKVTRLAVFSRDVTSQRRAESALRQNERYLEAIFNSIGDAVITTDMNGCIVRMNPVAEKLTGWSLGEASGLELSQVFRLSKADYYGEVENPVTKVLREGKAVGLTNGTQLTAKDGTRFQVTTNGSPICDGDGEIVGVVLVFRDVTKEYEVEGVLKESKEMSRALLNADGEAILLMDLAGNILDANKSTVQLFDKPLTEIIGNSYHKLLDPDLIAERMKYIRTVAETGKPHSFEDSHNGTDYFNTVIPLFNSSGGVTRLAVYTRDITESKRKDDLLSRMSHEQSVILQLGKTAFEADELAQFVDLANCLLAEVLDIEFTGLFQMIEGGGKLLLQAGSGWKEDHVGRLSFAINPDSLFDHTLKSSVPVVVKDLNRESRFSAPAVLADQKIISGICVVINNDNNPYGILGAFSTREYPFSEDMIQFFKSVANILSSALDRQLTKNLLHQSNETTRALLDANPNLALLIDAKGTLVAANERAVRELAATVESPVGKNAYELFPNILSGNRKNVLEKLFLHGIPIRFSDESSGKWFDNCFLPILDENGHVAKAAVYMREITEYKNFHDDLVKYRNNLRLRTQDLALLIKEQTFSSKAGSHGLRTAFHRIQGNENAPKQRHAERLDGEGLKFYDRLMSACQTMETLISDMLQLSQASLGKLHKEKINLSSLVGSIADNKLRAEPERKVIFKIAENLSVIGDSGLMRAMMENLIDNSWTSTMHKPIARIQFGRKRINGESAFYLKDNGVGFESKSGDGVFMPFRRTVTGREIETNGIGLAAVQRIVNRHGGKVWAEGEKGRGATFYFTLS